MKFKLIILSAAVVMLSGCAALEQMHEQWVRENCNPSAAFNTGLGDGLSAGKMPNRNYASSCPGNNPVLNEAYMRGFGQGLEKRPQQININKNVNVSNPPQNTQPASATGYQVSSAPAPVSHSYAADAQRQLNQVRRQNAEMRRMIAEANAKAQKAMEAARNVR